MTQITVFISYSSSDSTIAMRLAEDLARRDFDVWLDQLKLPVGQEFEKKIDAAVDAAHYVLILVSPNSMASDWVEREWRQKLQQEEQRQRVSIIPVLVESCEMPDFLAQRTHADISGGAYASGLSHIAEMIHLLSGRSQPMGADVQEESQADFTGLEPCIEPVTILVGGGLCERFAREEGGRNVLVHRHLADLRRRTFERFGFPGPPVHVTCEDSLPANVMEIQIDEIPELEFAMDPASDIVAAEPAELVRLGVSAAEWTDPLLRGPRSLVDEADQERVAALGYRTWDPSSYLADILFSLVPRFFDSFIDVDLTSLLLERAVHRSPALADSDVLKRLRVIDLTDVLRRLADEGVSIGDIETIIAGLEAAPEDASDTVELTEYARAALGREIWQPFLQADGALPLIRVAGDIEDLIAASIIRTYAGNYLDLDPQMLQQVAVEFENLVARLGRSDCRIPLLVRDPAVRVYLLRLLNLRFPELAVLAEPELGGQHDIVHTLATLRLPAPDSDGAQPR